jgi:hypothetical protein
MLLRGAVFFSIAAYQFFSPFYLQALNGRSKFLRSWRMFHREPSAAERIFVRYAVRDGSRLRIVDRFQTLGYARPATAPRRLNVIETPEQARDIGLELCARIGAQADLRIYLAERLGASRRWILKGESDACQ